jgi:hypothetical protein
MGQSLAIVLEPDPDLRDSAAAVLDEFGLQILELASPAAMLKCLEAHGNEVRLVVAGTAAASSRCSAIISKRWPRIRVLLAASSSEELTPDLPTGVSCVPQPWGLAAVLQVAAATSVS